MKVFKFGGASVKDAKGVVNITKILRSEKDSDIMLVLSAMGKTTNALETVLNSQCEQKEWQNSLIDIKQYHQDICKELFAINHSVFYELEDIFNSLKEILKEASFKNYDYYYDQLVSLGEILSTTIVSQYIEEEGIPCNFLDARQVIFTNNSYRSAKVDMKKTSLAITQQVPSRKGIWISQGFIAHDEQGHTTTLGREGSDYSAAIFASVLNVDELTIWKDVDGVFNADPKIFQNVQLIEQLSYKEAVELAFYGASIIHPKTIRPLQEKGIILKVRSFYHLENKGTQVSNSSLPNPKSASLIVKKNMGVIFQLLSKHQFHINLIQNSAISFSLCVDENYAHFEALKNDLMEYYKLRYNKNQVLLTIRHYQPETIENIYAHLKIKIEQRNRSTYQILISEEEFEGKLIGILG